MNFSATHRLCDEGHRAVNTHEEDLELPVVLTCMSLGCVRKQGGRPNGR